MATNNQHDVIIRNGTLYDGRGGEPRRADLAIAGDAIAAVGDLSAARGNLEIDAAGLAVAPGFINILSWASESLIEDGRSQSDIRQGVTLEVMGEGVSEGPVNDTIRAEMLRRMGDIQYDITWTTLDEYLETLVARGVSTNVASFVGAATIRSHVIGYEDRPPTPAELDAMRDLVRQAMVDGAVGLSSALIYTPGSYAGTDELIALARVAAEHDGLYISHIRNEGDQLLEALDEFIHIVREAGVRGEIYHLKAAGLDNWKLLKPAIARIEAARAAGLDISADVYTYAASSTGLNAIMPGWAQEGGFEAWRQRLQDPETRARIKAGMLQPSSEWENMFLATGPERMLLVGFKSEALRPLLGQTLAQVADARGTDPAETAMDLVVEDDSPVQVVYHSMSEENVRRKIGLPWVSFCSDARSLAPEGVFAQTSTHPRAYGAFARLLGRYVRDEGVIPLEEAIRRLTSFPAGRLKLDRRGVLAPGYFADVVIFDPATIQDHATYEEPHQYSTGVHHVLVNGTPVLRDGEHTGAFPGRVVRGPGTRGR
jgi:N-acyl-D-amino-acid deacylase